MVPCLPRYAPRTIVHNMYCILTPWPLSIWTTIFDGIVGVNGGYPSWTQTWRFRDFKFISHYYIPLHIHLCVPTYITTWFGGYATHRYHTINVYMKHNQIKLIFLYRFIFCVYTMLSQRTSALSFFLNIFVFIKQHFRNKI